MKLAWKDFFSDTHQLTRITILTGVAVLLAVFSFGGYYYWDRYVKLDDISPSEKSLQELEKAVGDNPQDPQPRLALAESYLVDRRYAEAIQQANQVLVALPDSDRAMLVVGVASVYEGKPDQAIAPLKKFIDIHEGTEMANRDMALEAALYFLGESYLQLGKPQDALQPLTRAIEISPTDADALYKLGVAYTQTGEHENALHMYESATTLVPNFMEAYQGMEASYVALGQTVQAEYARGMVAYSSKDYQGARKLLENVITAKSDFVPAFLGLGLVYEQLGDLKSAKTYADLAVKLDPQNLAAVQLQGRIESALQK